MKRAPFYGRYVLVGKLPVPCADLEQWGAFMERIDLRRVALTDLGSGVEVSTVFLGVDHGFGGQVRLFETMVFSDYGGGDVYRYETWAEAEQGHALIVAEQRAKIAASQVRTEGPCQGTQ